MRELLVESLIPLNGCKITHFFINMQKNRQFSTHYIVKIDFYHTILPYLPSLIG